MLHVEHSVDSNNRIAELENALAFAKHQRELQAAALQSQRTMEKQAMEIRRLQMLQRTSVMAAERLRRESSLSASQPMPISNMSGSVFQPARVQVRQQWNMCTASNPATTISRIPIQLQSQSQDLNCAAVAPELPLTTTQRLEQSLAANRKLQKALQANPVTPPSHVGSKRRLPDSFSMEGLEELQGGHQVKRHKGNNLHSKG